MRMKRKHEPKLTLCILTYKPKKDGTFVVWVRIYANYTTAYISTGITVLKSEWDGDKVVGRNDSEALNDKLQTILASYKIKSKIINDWLCSASELKDKILECRSNFLEYKDDDPLVEICDGLSKHSAINAYRAEVERLTSIVGRTRDCLYSFIANAKLRKKDEVILLDLITTIENK